MQYYKTSQINQAVTSLFNHQRKSFINIFQSAGLVLVHIHSRLMAAAKPHVTDVISNAHGEEMLLKTDVPLWLFYMTK